MTGRRKVVLYNPKAVFFTMPLGLLAVGSHLDRSRYDVTIVDARLERDPVAALLSALEGAVALGVGVLTGAPIRDAIEASRAVKERYPRLPVVWGGWHPSLFPAQCLEEPSVDVTVQAQGEETFAEILERLDGAGTAADGSIAALEGCSGCTFRAPGGEVRRNPPRTFADVGAFAPHDFSLLPVERYFDLKGKKQVDYVASQGCFFRCAFCADPYVFGRKWAGLSPERVGDELERLHRLHGMTDVNFQDETFFTYLDRVASIAGEFRRRRLPFSWAATMRADQGDRLTDDVWAECRASGMRRVLIGVEAGTQEMIDRIRKDIKLEQVFRCAEKAKRHGVAVNFPFIVCFPGETDASVRASLEVARRLREMSPSFQTPVFFFKPYPGTPLTDEAVREGYRPPSTLEEWADFDIYDAESPWVTPERSRLVAGFRHYQEVAYSRGPAWKEPLRRLARWRCERSAYAFPVGKAVSELLSPPQNLS